MEDAKLYLIKWRIENNMSQHDMAKMMRRRKVPGVTQSTISRWEKGDRTPTLEQAFVLEDLGVCDARIWIEYEISKH
jgi:transcriptional regulator with XRE-family HTH domain